MQEFINLKKNDESIKLKGLIRLTKFDLVLIERIFIVKEVL